MVLEYFVLYVNLLPEMFSVVFPTSLALKISFVFSGVP